MKVITTDIEAKVRGWLETPDAPGDWVAVFENHDLGHPHLGQRIALLYAVEAWDQAVIGKTTAPDSTLGLGWRYVLVAKVRDADEAVGLMTDTMTNANHDSPKGGA